ncbi:MAG: hypothetical protein ACT6Q8_24220 [Niveispirillum sp.]|uniref:hypothetical protein n=1 Tax=Niveispirillum sp. TaxID=1917217 RepID=UPI004036B9B7
MPTLPETDLFISGVAIPTGAGRNITQTLELIDNGDIRRTINGAAVDLTRAASRKYRSDIRATGVSTPALAGIVRGSAVTVHCIQRLRVPASGTSVTLPRTPVSGSVRGYQADGTRATLSSLIDRVATFSAPIVYAEFRPILTMLVADLSYDTDEYAASEGWSLSLEEA